MPYRPSPEHRRNINGVIYPLTAAVLQLYGSRPSDGALPIGAFYPVNVKRGVWERCDDIWYRPSSISAIEGRSFNQDLIPLFLAGIRGGATFLLPNGRSITWEAIPPGIWPSVPERNLRGAA